MLLGSSVAGSAHDTYAGIAAVPQPPRDVALHLPPTRFFAGAADCRVPLLLQQRGLDDGRPPADSSDIVRLAQAYALSSDPELGRSCVTALLDNSGESLTVAEGADAALRLIEWCWGLVLLGRLAADPLDPERVTSTITRYASHLRRCVSGYCPPPTDRASEALGLLYAATIMPGHADAAGWRDAGVRALIAEIRTQVGPDGVHVEQSSWCHRFTIEAYLHFLILAARTGIEVPPHVAASVQRMLDFLLAIRQPDGTIPSIGDSDGRRVVRLSSRGPQDARDLFAVAAVLFDRRDFAWAAGGVASELAWLLGVDGVEAFERLAPAPPASAPSRVFPSGGYAVMSSGWERDAHHLLIDIGPLGCAISGGRGHADLLSIQCAIFGDPAIVDPGTHCASGDSKWRDFFRSTAAHGTIAVDGESQAEPSGPFGWKQRPRVRLREWHSTPDFDFLDAEHDGYTRLPDPVVHRRRVIFVKPAYWILIDDLHDGTPPERAGRQRAARHQIELAFQFGAADVALGAHPWTRAVTTSGHVLWISPFPSAPAQPALKCGALSPIRGWTAPETGRLSPAPMLIYSFAVALPWRIVTLLLPDRHGLSVPPAVRPLYDSGGLPNGFVFERPRRTVHFDDHAVLVERE